MLVRNTIGMLVLTALLAAGAALAAELGQPATEPVDVDLEAVEAEAAQPEADAAVEAVGGEEEVVYEGFGTSQPFFTCSCECTCPASGAFEVQTFTLPLWTNRSCQSFNGDACSIGPFDTCNTVRSFANCKFI